MTLKKIRLELARTREFPEGNPRCGYEFTARIVRQVVARDMLTPGQRRRVLERLGR